MHSLVGLGGLRERRDEDGTRPVVLLPNLALVATLEVVLNVLIHPRPVVALENALFRFEKPIVTTE